MTERPFIAKPLDQKEGGAQIDTRLHRCYATDPLPEPLPLWAHCIGWLVVCALILAMVFVAMYGV